MSSVQDFMECPQCKGLYITVFNCRTTEETRKCFRCGRKEQWFIRRDDKGNAILNEQEQLQLDYEFNEGYGAMQFTTKDGFSQVGLFHEPVSEDIKQFFQEIVKDSTISKEKSYLTSWDMEEKKVVAVYGEIPPTCDEIIKAEQEAESRYS